MTGSSSVCAGIDVIGASTDVQSDAVAGALPISGAATTRASSTTRVHAAVSTIAAAPTATVATRACRDMDGNLSVGEVPRFSDAPRACAAFSSNAVVSAAVSEEDVSLTQQGVFQLE
jgi:hypothetical protein